MKEKLAIARRRFVVACNMMLFPNERLTDETLAKMYRCEPQDIAGDRAAIARVTGKILLAGLKSGVKRGR